MEVCIYVVIFALPTSQNSSFNDEAVFYYNNVVHKIQTIFTTNKIKKISYNKTWDYTNTIPITNRASLELNNK